MNKKFWLISALTAAAVFLAAPFIHYLITGEFPAGFPLQARSGGNEQAYSRRDADERRKRVEELFNSRDMGRSPEKLKEAESLAREAEERTREKKFGQAVELMDKAVAVLESLPEAKKLAPLKAFYLNTPRKIADDGADPSWSPDGKRIAFHSPAGQRGADVFVVNADGSGKRMLVKDAMDPAWGRGINSDKIAFLASPEQGEPGIWMINEAGSRKDLVVKTAAQSFAWSPDGRKLLFTSRKNIHICDSNGENIRSLTDLPADSGIEFAYPAFSGDGKKVIFGERGLPYRNDSVGDVRLWVMNADGSGRKVLFQAEGTDFNVYQEGSAGNKIVFDYHAAGEYSFLCRIDPDGKNRTVLANDPDYGLGDVAVSPDGKRVVFNKYRVKAGGNEAGDEPHGLWIMELN